jgi:hypothetical protein
MTGHMDPIPESSQARPGLVLPILLTVVAGALLFWTTRLPFTAGSRAIDLLVPIGALVLGAAGVLLAIRARRPGSNPAIPIVIAVLAALVTIASLFSLVAIFGLCGLYWTRTSC